VKEYKDAPAYLFTTHPEFRQDDCGAKAKHLLHVYKDMDSEEIKQMPIFNNEDIVSYLEFHLVDLIYPHLSKSTNSALKGLNLGNFRKANFKIALNDQVDQMEEGPTK